MPTIENPDAGQGPVLLDIGGDVGALIVTMPSHTADLEVEIRPAGASAHRSAAHSGPEDDTSHPHGHAHPHDHTQLHSAYPHVGVVGRPTSGGVHFSLVYPSVVAGDYELCPIPGDRVVLTATVAGGAVTQLDWPA